MSRDWAPRPEDEEAFAFDFGGLFIGLCLMGIACEVIAIIALIIHGL